MVFSCLCSISTRKQAGQPFMWEQKGVPTFNSLVGLRISQRNFCPVKWWPIVWSGYFFLALLIVLAAFFLPFFPLNLWPAAPDLLPFSMFIFASVAGTWLLVARLMLQSFQSSEDSSSHFLLGMAHAQCRQAGTSNHSAKWCTNFMPSSGKLKH